MIFFLNIVSNLDFPQYQDPLVNLKNTNNSQEKIEM